MKEKIADIVNKSIEELNATLDPKVPMEQGENTALYGKNGCLDSLALVSLIVTIEGYVEEETGVGLILANDKAMSQKNSPFATIGSLVEYIFSLLKQEVANA